ncbi:MAG: type II secretion system protein GspD, partial [Desulfurobacteriaceae bacterium]
MKRLPLILALSAAALTWNAPALASTKPNLVQVNFEDVDIKDFAKVVSQATGKNIVIPPSLRGKITIVSPKPIPKRELFNLFIAALDELGYQTVDYGSYVKIVRSREAPKESTTVASGKVDGGDRIVTFIYIPKHLESSSLKNVVRNMLSRLGKVTFVKESNALVITDKEKNIHKAIKVLNRLDHSPVSFEIKSFTLKNAKASDVEKVLEALLNKSIALDLSR